VRGPQSLADELLVFLWMFPDYVLDIDGRRNPCLLAGGYEFNLSEGTDNTPWQNVPQFDLGHDNARVRLWAGRLNNNSQFYSVPVLLKRGGET
jgi:hypothetical protein